MLWASYLEIEHLSNAGVELDSHHVVIEDVTRKDTIGGVGREKVSLKVYTDWKSSSNDTPINSPSIIYRFRWFGDREQVLGCENMRCDMIPVSV